LVRSVRYGSPKCLWKKDNIKEERERGREKHGKERKSQRRKQKEVEGRVGRGGEGGAGGRVSVGQIPDEVQALIDGERRLLKVEGPARLDLNLNEKTLLDLP